MDTSIPHSSSRAGVITRSHILQGGNGTLPTGTDDQVMDSGNETQVTPNLVSLSDVYRSCQSNSALNTEITVNNAPDFIRIENGKLKIQLKDVSTKLNHTDNTLRQNEHDLVNSKMELYESMKKLADARNEMRFHSWKRSLTMQVKKTVKR